MGFDFTVQLLPWTCVRGSCLKRPLDELRTGQSLKQFGLQDLVQLQLQIQFGMGPSDVEREALLTLAARVFSTTIHLLEERGRAALGVCSPPEQGAIRVTNRLLGID